MTTAPARRRFAAAELETAVVLSVKTIPGVREAIEQNEYAEAQVEIGRVAHALEREAALLDSATSTLSR